MHASRGCGRVECSGVVESGGYEVPTRGCRRRCRRLRGDVVGGVIEVVGSVEWLARCVLLVIKTRLSFVIDNSNGVLDGIHASIK